jgi:hypothetical protein
MVLSTAWTTPFSPTQNELMMENDWEKDRIRDRFNVKTYKMAVVPSSISTYTAEEE